MFEHLLIGASVEGLAGVYQIVETPFGESFLSSDSYTISYLAYDAENDRLVELREYFYAEFVERKGERVHPLVTSESRTSFEAGKDAFLKSCAALDGKLDHFMENGTAYLVLPIDIENSTEAGALLAILSEIRSSKTVRVASVQRRQTKLLPMVTAGILLLGTGFVGVQYFMSDRTANETTHPQETVEESTIAETEVAINDLESEPEAEPLAVELEVQNAEELPVADEPEPEAEPLVEPEAEVQEESTIAETEVAINDPEAEPLAVELEVQNAEELPVAAEPLEDSKSDTDIQREIEALKAANEILISTMPNASGSSGVDGQVICTTHFTKFEISTVFNAHSDPFENLSLIRASRFAGDLVKGEPLDKAMSTAFGQGAGSKGHQEKATAILCAEFPQLCDANIKICD